MSSAIRAAIKEAISERVQSDLAQGLPNPLTSVADHRKNLIGSMFLAELPRSRRTSIFSALVAYEGGYFD